MEQDRHKLWDEAMMRCCDNWRACFERAMQLADAPAEAPLELCLLQTHWLAANLQRPYEHWTKLFEAAAATDSGEFKCPLARMQAENGDFARLGAAFAELSPAGDDERRKRLSGLLDAAYTDWLRTSRPGEGV